MRPLPLNEAGKMWVSDIKRIDAVTRIIKHINEHQQHVASMTVTRAQYRAMMISQMMVEARAGGESITNASVDRNMELRALRPVGRIRVKMA